MSDNSITNDIFDKYKELLMHILNDNKNMTEITIKLSNNGEQITFNDNNAIISHINKMNSEFKTRKEKEKEEKERERKEKERERNEKEKERKEKERERKEKEEIERKEKERERKEERERQEKEEEREKRTQEITKLIDKMLTAKQFNRNKYKGLIIDNLLQLERVQLEIVPFEISFNTNNQSDTLKFENTKDLKKWILDGNYRKMIKSSKNENENENRNYNNKTLKRMRLLESIRK